MKNIVLGLMMTLNCVGCANSFEAREVSFKWFNSSTNQIWVTDVMGLPPEAAPGRLMPKNSDGRQKSKEAVFAETVRIEDKIQIQWKDNGIKAWPGGLKPGEQVPPGTAHEVTFTRDKLGIPAKMTSGKIHLTYLGNDNWQIKLFP